jgi:hypothetical protein
MLSTLLAAAAAAATAVQPAAAQAPPEPTVQFGPAQQVSAGGKRVDRSEPVGGVDATGRALLVWSETERRRSRIVVASAPAGGPFGPPRALARGSSPVLGVAPDGRALIAFSGARGGRLSAGDTTGRFAAPATLPGRRRPSAIAMAGDGTAAIVSANLRGSTVRLVAAGGRLGAVRRFDQYVPEGTLLVGDDGSAGFGEAELAAGPDGTIALLTRRGLLERRPGERTFARAHRPLRRPAADPRVAVGPGGRIGVTAIDRPLCIGEYGCVGRVVLAERLPGTATFAAPTQAPVMRYPKDGGARVPAGYGPELAYGPAGGPLVTWTEDERVCTECDMDGPDGPRIAWQPGGERHTLSTTSSGATLVPAAGRVAIAVQPFLGEDPGEPELVLTTAGAPARVAAGSAFPWKAGDLLTGGPTRLLVADGGYGQPVRAALGAVTR